MARDRAPILQGTLDVTVAMGRRAKVCSLTTAGRKQLAEQRESWVRFFGALAAILRTT